MNAKLNRTPVKRVQVLHHTSRFWTIVLAIVAYTILTSAITYGVIVKNYSIHQGQCEMTMNVPESIYSDNKLITKVSSTYTLHKNDAQVIVELVKTHISKHNNFTTVEMILAIMATESSFKHDSKSHAGAVGIMQVMPGSRTIASNDLNQNIYNGIKVLYNYHIQLGSVEKALHAYNLGIGNYMKGQRVPEYVGKVMANYQRFKEVKET